MDTNTPNIPKVLKAIKQQLKMSDVNLAKHLGVSANSVSNWLKGKSSPKNGKLTKIIEEAKALNLFDGKLPIASSKSKTPKTQKSAKIQKTQINKPEQMQGLLVEYFRKVAQVNKKDTFVIEFEGIKHEKHHKEISAEKWAEVMAILDEV